MEEISENIIKLTIFLLSKNRGGNYINNINYKTINFHKSKY